MEKKLVPRSAQVKKRITYPVTRCRSPSSIVVAVVAVLLLLLLLLERYHGNAPLELVPGRDMCLCLCLCLDLAIRNRNRERGLSVAHPVSTQTASSLEPEVKRFEASLRSGAPASGYIGRACDIVLEIPWKQYLQASNVPWAAKQYCYGFWTGSRFWPTGPGTTPSGQQLLL